MPLFSTSVNFKSLPWGKIGSSIALIAGTTVGAGVLALPSVTFTAGVLPSTALLILVWGYTFFSGLLIAEVTVNHAQGDNEDQRVGLLGLTEQYLGKAWGQIATLAFLFLHYSLLVAYVSEGGTTLQLILTDFLQLTHLIPNGLEIVAFVCLLGGLVAMGPKHLVARINTILVGGVMLAFGGLLWAIATQLDLSQAAFINWKAASPAIPVMLVAMFYHNVIPVVTQRLSGEVWPIRMSLFFGSLIPLLMFLIWNGVVLCSVGLDGLSLGIDPLDILREQISSVSVNLWITLFSLLAVATSFIGVSYGLLNIFQDLLRQNDGNDEFNTLSINALVFVPPLGLCSLNPDLFITALSYAGTFSVATLYGLLPAVLAWRSRYSDDGVAQHEAWTLGGRWFLSGMIAIPCLFILLG